MAMNIHQEARRRQMHMDRVCEARRKMALSNDDAQVSGAGLSAGSDSDPLMCTDQGQFYQTSASRPRDCVVFEQVVHDPNFHYRSAVERGLPPPLHVNTIYKVMYPAAYVEVPARRRQAH
ncbi:hypothetical protein PoB_004504400 [Plakobranchus ocellatus]|uniref:Uncharacterized protein n=1 Tax=Plakobranchus ocellatus TaxID=259542 RepID=A0AAV4BJQ0_9GAST|nr:hypothetical protein PoB_004504400 [Plakobranchus ocellatus]